MSLSEIIPRLRASRKLSQSQFAELFHVSQQAVQKWERGASQPDLEKITAMAAYFGLSVDALIHGELPEDAEPITITREIRPDFEGFSQWESYSSDLMAEFQQSMEEGLDLGARRNLFQSVAALPEDEIKAELASVLGKLVLNAPMRPDYPYREPSDPAEIHALRKPFPVQESLPDREVLRKKIRGAWTGRICGCLLGKTLEGIRTPELNRFLKETGNFPMHRYVRSAELTPERCGRYRFPLAGRICADGQPYAPFDDDTNYTVLAQMTVDRYGRNFTSRDAARMWLFSQPQDQYCTAERVAYRNLVQGYQPPDSARYQNPYREWIGAQIRGDYFGYINPGDPETAADMAFRDGCISHVKNGIYGEMFAAAMIACAAVTDDVETAIRGGLAWIPATSRLWEAVTAVLEIRKEQKPQKEVWNLIHRKYDENTEYGWCHVIPNAMIVTASLLWGEKDYGRTICTAVQAGYDTDCNGATAGSVLGMMLGDSGIGAEWKAPICGMLETTLFGSGMISVEKLTEKTLEHLKK